MAKPSDAARDGSGAPLGAEHAPISDPVLEAVKAARQIVHFRDSPEITVHRYIDYMRHLDTGTIVKIARALLSLVMHER